MKNEPACLQVPVYEDDVELGLMMMLEFVMRSQQGVTSAAEQERIVAWFSDRYGNPPSEAEQDQ